MAVAIAMDVAHESGRSIPLGPARELLPLVADQRPADERALERGPRSRSHGKAVV
jgi:hypothetical protein